VKYLRLSRDPLEDGLDVVAAEQILQAIQSRSGNLGRLEIVDQGDTPDSYYIVVEDAGQEKTLVDFLKKRNITYNVFDAPIGAAGSLPEVIPEHGVIFLLVLDPAAFPFEKAAAFLPAIAGVFAEKWNSGEPVLRAGMRPEANGTYWVGFNLVGAAQSLAARLADRGVRYKHSRTLNGARPQLSLVSLGEALPVPATEQSPTRGRQLPLLGQPGDAPPDGGQPTDGGQGRRRRRGLLGGAASYLGLTQLDGDEPS
jgi:hypothetical protein